MDTWLEEEGVVEDVKRRRRRRRMETIESIMARQAKIAIQQSQANIEELMNKCAATAVEAAQKSWRQEMEATNRAIENKMDIMLQQSEEKLVGMISKFDSRTLSRKTLSRWTGRTSRWPYGIFLQRERSERESRCAH
mmetsp:Transcript_23210/g.69092  ORF Transcript_23210/g.69092 Transcript_23210/m.69092 type:complete len:137 (+) Transcript_23210:337-747(+)